MTKFLFFYTIFVKGIFSIDLFLHTSLTKEVNFYCCIFSHHFHALCMMYEIPKNRKDKKKQKKKKISSAVV